MSFDEICDSAIIKFIVSVERLLSVTILQHHAKNTSPLSYYKATTS